MEDIFEIMTATEEESDEAIVRLGIRLNIGGHETICPILKTCKSYGALKAEIEAIRKNLEKIMKSAEKLFRDTPSEGSPALSPDMAPEEIWSVLSGTADEDDFVQAFNSLDEPKRREVAEYVLTQCNIFSGNASVFSSRYNNSLALLE